MKKKVWVVKEYSSEFSHYYVFESKEAADVFFYHNDANPAVVCDSEKELNDWLAKNNAEVQKIL